MRDVIDTNDPRFQRMRAYARRPRRTTNQVTADRIAEFIETYRHRLSDENREVLDELRAFIESYDEDE